MTTPEPDRAAPAPAVSGDLDAQQPSLAGGPEPHQPTPADRPKPHQPAQPHGALPPRPTPLLERRRGPWRVAVVEGSMLPAIRPGDWLLVDPTTDRWPRRGSIVVFTEPDSGTLSVKRVAGRPGDRVPFEGGYLHLGPDEAWLLADADEATAAAAGFGTPIDSRRYGPVPVELLVGRAWFRYAPLDRLGLLPGRSGSRRT